MTEKTGSTKQVEHVHHEQGMEYWGGKFDVTEMAWTSEICQTTCRTTEILKLSSTHGVLADDKTDVHVLFIARTERRVIQTANVRPVEIIKEDRIDDLFYGNTADVL